LFNYIIIGSGFAGSVLAERIANVLNKKVLIIEKRNNIGGNCCDMKYFFVIYSYNSLRGYWGRKE